MHRFKGFDIYIYLKSGDMLYFKKCSNFKCDGYQITFYRKPYIFTEYFLKSIKWVEVRYHA